MYTYNLLLHNRPVGAFVCAMVYVIRCPHWWCLWPSWTPQPDTLLQPPQGNPVLSHCQLSVQCNNQDLKEPDRTLHQTQVRGDACSVMLSPCNTPDPGSHGPQRPQRRNSKKNQVQWSEDVIKADPFLRRSRVRFRVPPWVSNTKARNHLA